jgi:hypothetical protein
MAPEGAKFVQHTMLDISCSMFYFLTGVPK